MCRADTGSVSREAVVSVTVTSRDSSSYREYRHQVREDGEGKWVM